MLSARQEAPESLRRHYESVDEIILSIDGLYRAMGEPGRKGGAPQFCDACFTGDYPTDLTDIAGGTNTAQLSLLAELV